MFTLVNSVVLRALPYPEPHRLMWITQSHPGLPAEMDGVSYADFLDVKEANRSFTAIEAYSNEGVGTLDPQTDPYQFRLYETTPGLFSLLGAQVVLGRLLLPRDEDPANPRVTLLNHEFWATRMGGRDDVLGKHIRIPMGDRNLDLLIVGVLAPSFELPAIASRPPMPSLWVTPGFLSGPPSRSFPMFSVIGLLRPGVSLETGREDVSVISERLARAYPETNRGRITLVAALIDEVVGETRVILWLFFAAVCCVLLIALVNLTNLQVVRNAERQHEIHIRAALGARRPQLLRLELLESLVLSLCGGALGLLVGWGGTRLVLATVPPRMPRIDEVSLDLRVFLVVFGVSLATGIVTGLIPAWRTSRLDLFSAVTEDAWSATMSARRGRLHSSLIAVETALALALLVSAALLTQSLWRLVTTDAGMEEEQLWSVKVELPLTYRSKDAQQSYWAEALESVRTLPQVDVAGAVLGAPSPLSGTDVMIGGVRPYSSDRVPGSEGLILSKRSVTANFFAALGVSVIRGRPILATDVIGAEGVVVLNEVAARALWAQGDPIGRYVSGAAREPLRVVGIVPGFKHSRLDGDIVPQMYTAYAQQGRGAIGSIMVRLEPSSVGFPAAVDTVIRRLEEHAIVTVTSMNQIRWRLVAEERFGAGILLIFALTSGVLVTVGVFGVVSYAVVRRKREIGLRLALGATDRDAIWLVVRGAMAATMIGLTAGLLVSLVATQALSSFLYEVTATDPTAFAGAIVCLLLTVFVASTVPARRSTRTDPAEILRGR